MQLHQWKHSRDSAYKNPKFKINMAYAHNAAYAIFGFGLDKKLFHGGV